MKKLILSAAIVLGGLTAATAQTEKEPTAMNAQKQSATQAQMENRLDAAQDAAIPSKPVQDYKEVKVTDVPVPVREAVKKDFSGATISKAYVNANGEYKIDLATADKKASTVYATAQGEWIKSDKKAVKAMKKQ
ncbi:hypothetical protein [Aequorivita echinoideorum]|uniref:Uncharacterized protein n=1 Tax=Aequorivita echinoideorum TaxID=1549647 RepID=A0ABS5S137_9FLAO|nr:hypothetical protein [Aequorivita echinoideorum]MBT0606890.1 hypothetical protein [Aequorivita echinoideorum]